MSTNKKREDINTLVCAVSLLIAETPKASPITITPFGIVTYSFVGQQSKQLKLAREHDESVLIG